MILPFLCRKFSPLDPSIFCPSAGRKEFSQVCCYAGFSTTQKPDHRIGFLHYLIAEINLSQLP